MIKDAIDIPVIASLNATTTGGWVRYATLLVNAGADAIELNLYSVAADPDRTAADVENERLAVVADVRAAIGVPLAVKLSPYFSSMANFARRVISAGANGLVLFNRFYQPDIDLDALDVVPRVELSSPWELRLPLRWTAILRPLLGDDVSLAATTGIASGTDAAKAIAVGADVAMMTSAILRHGPEHDQNGDHRAADLARRPRVRVRGPAARKHELQQRRRPERVRARQLHAGASLLDFAVEAANSCSTDRRHLPVDRGRWRKNHASIWQAPVESGGRRHHHGNMR